MIIINKVISYASLHCLQKAADANTTVLIIMYMSCISSETYFNCNPHYCNTNDIGTENQLLEVGTRNFRIVV